jgi:hypothetical protein
MHAGDEQHAAPVIDRGDELGGQREASRLGSAQGLDSGIRFWVLRG